MAEIGSLALSLNPLDFFPCGLTHMVPESTIQVFEEVKKPALTPINDTYETHQQETWQITQSIVLAHISLWQPMAL